MRKHILLLALLFLGTSMQAIFAQTTPAHALKNITIHNADGSVTESATIVWRNGVIEAVGTNVNIPFDAFEIDGGDSLHVYPGLIDGFSIWGSPDLPRNLEELDNPGDPPYDRAGIQPERKPSLLLKEDKAFETGMKAGFTTAALYPNGYMLPGQVEAFYLAPESDKVRLLKESLALAGSFDEAPGGWGNGAYPSTMMGVMAQFRQLMFDATALQQHIKYYSQNPEMPAPNRDKVLEALFPLVNKATPLYFEVDSKEHMERLFKLQDEFGFKAVVVSGKEAYAKSAELKRRNIPVLASIDFTEAPEWYSKMKKAEEKSEDEKEDSDETEEKEEEISEEEQQYRDKRLAAWKAEVMNIRKLMDAGVSVGYASAGLDLKDLSEKLEILMDEGGLSEADVVKLMTINTASILGLNNTLGSLAKGKNASFTVFDKAMSEDKVKVLHSISNGTIHEFNGE
ncbi:amidohydrolase family protein [Gracilimonas sediminicola]|uniref:Amidohydrolase family protein n=1 Tax=Gracilimonas sediminicola TaxID=2952158 RepID=A0A9X2L5A7_9BACT|nr:amidohydrolase family protein [Gracilimonas sediminicola]MCP9292592.1 amidohydrolase family protein [Gracilimonas sediminicola]